MYEKYERATARLCNVRKGAWSNEEDDLLRKCIQKYGEGNWKRVPQRAGLNRCRKSCRWRWLNYLKPSIKRGDFSEDEIDFIIKQHKLLGNRWSLIAARLPGRTINDIKNYCNTLIFKKFSDEAISLDANNNILHKTHGSNIQNADNTNDDQDWASQEANFSHQMSPKSASTVSDGPWPNNLVILEKLHNVEEETQDIIVNCWDTFLEEVPRDTRDNSQIINGPKFGLNSWQEEPNFNEQIDNGLVGEGGISVWQEDLWEFDVNLWP